MIHHILTPYLLLTIKHNALDLSATRVGRHEAAWMGLGKTINLNQN